MKSARVTCRDNKKVYKTKRTITVLIQSTKTPSVVICENENRKNSNQEEMKADFVVLNFILLMSFVKIDAQKDDLFCRYSSLGTVYICELTIQNPNGRDDFNEIEGEHEFDHDNSDVLVTTRVGGSVSSNVPSIICSDFPNLATLSLWDIGIERVSENAFKNCKLISTVNLEKNRITELDENVFRENLKLEYLFLGFNQLTTLPGNIFINQHVLMTLWIDNNRITHLPENVFRSLRKLTSLNINENQLSTLTPNIFNSLKNLESLSLSSNNIKELPKNIFNSLRKLTGLWIENNDIKTISSKSFSVHRDLKFVGLSNNQINGIDRVFINNVEVVRLNMIGNICANKVIVDDSPSKKILKAELKICFKNFHK